MQREALEQVIRELDTAAGALHRADRLLGGMSCQRKLLAVELSIRRLGKATGAVMRAILEDMEEKNNDD